MGAVAEGGRYLIDADLDDTLQIPKALIDARLQRELTEIELRKRLYRAGCPAPQLRGRIVIFVDDGLATGSTMQASIQLLRKANPARIVFAVPVALPNPTRAASTVDAWALDAWTLVAWTLEAWSLVAWTLEAIPGYRLARLQACFIACCLPLGRKRPNVIEHDLRQKKGGRVNFAHPAPFVDQEYLQQMVV